MTSQDTPEYKGAKFYKCALQVNPHTYSEKYQGQEEPMPEDEYNKAMLQQCRECKIKIVGLADHGNVQNSESLRQLLKNNGIVVFPGFEIASSEKIHMVCLYPEDTLVRTLDQYLGVLMGNNVSKLKENPEHPSSESCESIAELVLNQQNGFWYSAHMTGSNGLLRLTHAGDNHKHIWKNEGLLIAGQIPGTIENLDVSREDHKKYREIIENKNPDYRRNRHIAIINAKDIGVPDTLNDLAASCLIKMTKPNFKAFKQAFHDPESRIRLNREHDRDSEKSYSIIKSIHWEGGGFFRDEGIALSDQLNAVIGGRGTGKSTFLESLRYALDMPYWNDDESASNLVVANLRNSRIIVRIKSKAQNDHVYEISRRYGEMPQICNEEGETSHLEPSQILPNIDIIGQNEILAIERNENNKRELVQRFLPSNERHDEDMRNLRKKLHINRDGYVRAEQELESLKETIQQKPRFQEQWNQFKRWGVQEKLRPVQDLEKEKVVDDNIKDILKKLKNWLEDYEDFFDLDFLSNKSIEPLPSKEILIDIRKSIEELKQKMDNLMQDAKKTYNASEEELGELYERWNFHRKEIREILYNSTAELPEYAGKSGREIADAYRSLVIKLQNIERKSKAYEQQKRVLDELKKERKSLLKQYRYKAFERFEAMRRAAEDCNQGELKGRVKISIFSCADLTELKEFLINIHGLGEGKVAWLDKVEEHIDLANWSEWIENNKGDRFVQEYEKYGLTLSTAKKLCSLDTQDRLAMEEIELKDIVQIELNVAHDHSEDKYIPLDRLSTGQKCTAILNMLLVSRDDPLIFDQPEDNLDNAFIAERIVKDIRHLKNRRQFLFTTHNANIPVFGDAELIAVLGSDGETGRINYQGGIDQDDVQKQAADILEGGEEAFNVRKAKYGF